MINQVNYMSLKAVMRQGTGRMMEKQTSFFESVVSERERMRQVSGTGNQAPDSGMSLEQYKQRIYDHISNMWRHPSKLLESVSVSITDEGFEAMKNDPEYEKWVLDGIRENFAAYNPWTNVCGGGYCVLTFGATEEDYRGEGWYPGYAGAMGAQLFEEKSENSFWCSKSPNHEYDLEKSKGVDRHEKEENYWEKRARVFKDNLELTQELNLKRKIQEAAQKRREAMYGDEEQGYLAGVSAAELLSVVM